MRAPRLDPNHVDLAAFEAWLRAQLPGPAFAAVLALVLQVIRVLFEQNTLLRARINGRRPKPPSEKLATIERQLQFSFAVPINDVTAGAAAGAAREAAGEGDQGAKEEPEKSNRPGLAVTKAALPLRHGALGVGSVEPERARCEQHRAGATYAPTPRRSARDATVAGDSATPRVHRLGAAHSRGSTGNSTPQCSRMKSLAADSTRSSYSGTSSTQRDHSRACVAASAVT